ncbi:hypothetical protein F511_09958 [Dorcoceras hygrometricum]|uniref:Uncharacterized protein n=1 Tax=Dorcoceras hygrometricum TaxID=472368 RepID=A0A2Z7ADU0_9LAMI|nr:hypothetical protein F511_09958 [Dorcoceras hygrometricum]
MKNAYVVFVEAKRQIVDAKKSIAKRKLKAHEDSRADELKKKQIGKRKPRQGPKLVQHKSAIPVATTRSVVAAHPIAGAAGGDQPMVVEHPHLEDPVTKVIVETCAEAQIEAVVPSLGEC